MNPVFGEPWGVYEYAPRIPVPLGQPCAWCEVLFVPGDRGVAMPYGKADGTVGLSNWHRECLMRSLCGSVAHMQGECSCTGGTDPQPVTPDERRADAIAAWDQWYQLAARD